jgi:DNA invertase Pin-like site-specific DNA recombinase
LPSALRAEELEVDLATKLDWLGRPAIETLTLLEEAEAPNVSVVVTDRGFGTSTAVGRLTTNVLAAVEESKGELAQGRREVGVRPARGRGMKFGHRPKPVPLAPWRAVESMRSVGLIVRAIDRWSTYPIAGRPYALVPEVPLSEASDQPPEDGGRPVAASFGTPSSKETGV